MPEIVDSAGRLIVVDDEAVNFTQRSGLRLFPETILGIH
jgi:hypothetical protein